MYGVHFAQRYPVISTHCCSQSRATFSTSTSIPSTTHSAYPSYIQETNLSYKLDNANAQPAFHNQPLSSLRQITAIIMSSSLPHPKSFLTKIISSLPQTSTSTDANPLKGVSHTTRHLLQTLHVLYPNEFLPALDLLDRHLITRLVNNSPQDSPTTPNSVTDANNVPATEAVAPSSPSQRVTYKLIPPHRTTEVRHEPTRSGEKTWIYYVRSAQPQKPSYIPGGTTGRNYDSLSTHYEVRPLAWNCSCPAFAFAAFPATLGNYDDEDAVEAETTRGRRGEREERDDWNGEWRFGGLSRGRGAPVCKHLLACVLVERCAVFAPCIDERSATIEEIAGLCAGWGG
jgi:hypothetical protein